MTKLIIKCPKCEKSLGLTITRKGTSCEICSCGFPENQKIYEWELQR